MNGMLSQLAESVCHEEIVGRVELTKSIQLHTVTYTIPQQSTSLSLVVITSPVAIMPLSTTSNLLLHSNTKCNFYFITIIYSASECCSIALALALALALAHIFSNIMVWQQSHCSLHAETGLALAAQQKGLYQCVLVL